MPPNRDALFSYAHKDGDAARPLEKALSAAGLRVWFEAVVEYDFKSITRAIEDGLANSKGLIAYYCWAYVASRACQWALTTALLAG
jgi:TIR domain